jgi:hypothetical protein
MSRYMIGGYEEYSALHLIPVNGDHGVELPVRLYLRWKNARAELDAAQREVVSHLRQTGGRDAIPEELWEAADRKGSPARSWDSQ